jgi:hypothetical protein
MTFDYFLDQKVTTWHRTRFEIKADNQEQADEMAKDFVLSGQINDIEWENLIDTTEMLSIEENYNQPTSELFQSNSEDEKIWDNKQA